jgi:carboxyl-terminal processing protease
VSDGLDKDWGDVQESSLHSAISYITSGTFRSQAAGTRNNGVIYSEQPEVKSGNNVLDAPSFKGTIDTRKFK